MMWIQNLNAPIMKIMSKDAVVKLMAAQFGIAPDQTALIEDIGLLSPDAVMRTTSVLGEIDVPINAPNPVLVCVGEKETVFAKNMARDYVKALKKRARGDRPRWARVECAASHPIRGYRAGVCRPTRRCRMRSMALG